MDAINDFVAIPIVQLLVGSVIGAVVSLLVSRYYYKRSSEQLSDEVDQLRKLSVMVMDVLEQAGYVKWVRNEQGRPTGKIVELKGSMGGQGTMSVQDRLTDIDAANPAEQDKLDTRHDT